VHSIILSFAFEMSIILEVIGTCLSKVLIDRIDQELVLRFARKPIKLVYLFYYYENVQQVQQLSQNNLKPNIFLRMYEDGDHCDIAIVLDHISIVKCTTLHIALGHFARVYQSLLSNCKYVNLTPDLRTIVIGKMFEKLNDCKIVPNELLYLINFEWVQSQVFIAYLYKEMEVLDNKMKDLVVRQQALTEEIDAREALLSKLYTLMDKK